MNQYSYIANAEPVALEHLYESWKKDPESVDISWKKFFEGFEFANQSSFSAENVDASQLQKELAVAQLIEAWRSRGHLVAKTNPIRPRLDRQPALSLSDYGLNDADLNSTFHAGASIGMNGATLRDILAQLEKLYAGNIGVEYMHIRSKWMREWMQQQFESRWPNYQLSIEKKKRALHKLTEASVFENFLHKKFVGQKRFSLEGGENTIPALDAIINHGADLGVQRFAIGMAHRGRLNVLANILEKSYDYIFNEFEGNINPGVSFGDGDVKYHMGFSHDSITPNNKEVYLALVPNPSHLEAVNPVLEGYLRGKGDSWYGGDRSKLMPILIHGDAALSGQGIIYEVAQMSQLPGYYTGGTIHFVINNQIGFTTNFSDSRSTDYSTAIAKAIDSPVFHVNGDDTEAVVFAVEMATEFRQQFGVDVFVDMVCYRKHGHNESDEPKFTQPHFYDLISKHKSPLEIYRQQLLTAGDVTEEWAKNDEKSFNDLLQDRLNNVKQKNIPELKTHASRQWEKMRRSSAEDFQKSPITGVSVKATDVVIQALTKIPSEVTPIKKVQQLLADRAKMYQDGVVDWALAELMAYGTLLHEGKNVRISGQDVIRGTFSHRHAGFFDQETEKFYNSLNGIGTEQGEFRIYNSLLSEYAVLGFEYGYSMSNPNNLTIWEAQFGDFSNGAQTMIDQFIASGESKWQRMNGLVMLLPHGYEGQGPEHSNARPERYLQLAAEDNMVIANCTSPSNYFHLLRRQLTWNFRKPLVVMSPKSLLRHPLVKSNVKELHGKTFFQEVLDDSFVGTAPQVTKVLFCTGKVYFDLLAKQQADSRKDIAIVRLEQLFPLPQIQLEAIMAKYKNASLVWVQEEPANMGYWTYLLRYKFLRNSLDVIARKESASPATGYAKVHAQEQSNIVEKAFA
jgi:2-oxoglutarate dehydrogenase E1 component